ncbi:hypothetical protein FRB95_013402 [Tulasnella sp. JGI-2019a]|nr:hypothetical protein FRB95_013402 [Tulasnella sp. JGI-2019a]
MATVCFRMLQALRRNICDLDSNLLNSEVKDLGERIRERIPPALQYACMHIAAHVAHTAVSSADIHSLVGRFARESLMYWLESLSLMGRAHEAVGMVALIEAWLKTSLTGTTPAHSSSLSSTTKHIKPDDLALTLLYDLRRFVMEFMEPIVTSTCHIYLTGILLMPSETGLSRQYRHLGESGIRVVRGYARQWPQALWTASKHSSAITCVAVSPDGTTIVSGSYDHTLHLWDAKTGAAIGEAMKGHTNSVSCVAVSPDGTTIVSGSYGHTLHLWDAKTGAAIGKATDSHVS